MSSGDFTSSDYFLDKKSPMSILYQYSAAKGAQSMSNEVYNTKEASDLLRVSTQTLIRWVKLGKIAFVKIGKDYRFTQQTIEGLLTPHAKQQS